MTRAPRIDTLRNRIDATTQLLATVATELDDLHVLAYERQTAAREIAVNGGSRDWALDTHGNPVARNAYIAVGEATIAACNQLAEASHDAIRVLRDGPGTDRPRTRRIIDAAEYASALAAQARRDDRHDYTPTRHVPQPEVDGIKHTIDRLIRERDDAITHLERLARRLERYEPAAKRGRRQPR